ncbi:MAG: ATP-binding protein [Pseudomonadota bacterium]
MIHAYFICGFVCSGKTAYSRVLAADKSAFRFSIDEWMIPLFGEHMEREVFDARLATLESLFRGSALQLVALGVPVIFDFGYWRARDRAAAVTWASKHGLEYEVHYLDTPFETCKQRAAARNAHREDNSYEITPEMLELFWSWFEEPKATEDVLRVSAE